MESRCGDDRPMTSSTCKRKKTQTRKKKRCRWDEGGGLGEAVSKKMSRAYLELPSLRRRCRRQPLCFAFKSLHLARSAQRGQRLSTERLGMSGCRCLSFRAAGGGASGGRVDGGVGWLESHSCCCCCCADGGLRLHLRRRRRRRRRSWILLTGAFNVSPSNLSRRAREERANRWI